MTPYWNIGVTPVEFSYMCVHVLDPQNNLPISDVKFTIRSDNGLIELVTDKNGILRIPVSESLRKENPPLIKDYPKKLKLMFGLTGRGSMLNTDREIHIVSLAEKKRIQETTLTVWYSPDHEAEAESVLDQMKRQRQIIEHATGLEPSPWGVILVSEVTDVNLLFPLQCGTTVWPFLLDDLKSGRFSRTNTHEWTENTIERHLNLHDKDKMHRNRFVVDGLADYIAFLHAGLPAHYEEPLIKILTDGIEQVNLLKDFQSVRYRSSHVTVKDIKKNLRDREKVFAAGYPLSFVFWYQLCEENGATLPALLLKELQEEKQQDADSIIAILERITKRDNIRKSIENADVQQAISLIEKLRLSASKRCDP